MKKVLVITYYFPPCGGIPVIRPLKLIKYIRDFGWEPVLVTPKDAHYPSFDNEMLEDFPQDIERIKVPIWEPYSLYKKFTSRKKDENVNNVLVASDEKSKSWKAKLAVFIRSNFFIPDARKFWIGPVVKEVSKYLSNNKIDAIITTGPPHSVNLIGAHLKSQFDLPWLADFQDPWTQVDYYKELILTDWANNKHHQLEQQIFKEADIITTVSDAWKDDLYAIGAKNVAVVPLGYDPKDFSMLSNRSDSKKMRITHLGLVGKDRVPYQLLDIIIELGVELEGFSTQFELQFIGQVDYSIIEFIERHKKKNLISFVSQLTRKEALQKGKSSDVLLMLLNKADNSIGRIPGKLFEYLALEKTILSLGNTKGDSSKIIAETGMGECLEYNQKKEVKQLITSMFLEWKENGKLTPQKSSAYARYKSQNIAEAFSEALKSIL
ncbi:glycosyl transferase family 1 [Flammeovirga pectinis]|uniref:Glycosyl transferase family 1 n=1 Tax=Flammeovirga pectinis TaxID=2494373 RepID=A0A3Q9FMS9_9BACT|nr:glycosyltransferase [Flammeovirga pectinis]AZQ63373.1 glycosyl transferase family 1 [Flammeovirga pectinis]